MLYLILNVIGKKNNPTLVSNADLDSQTFGSMNNAGNSVNLVSDIFHLPRVGISLSALETDDRFYLSKLSSSCIF